MAHIETPTDATAEMLAAKSQANWKTCVDAEIDQLGWREATRVEQPGDDVTIYAIEVTPTEDLVFRPEGPATFSFSVFLDGSGTLSVDGVKPLCVQPGTAVFFACDRITRGENNVNAGRRLSVVDIRKEKPCSKSWAAFRSPASVAR